MQGRSTVDCKSRPVRGHDADRGMQAWHAAEDSSDPIKIVMNNWTSQLVLSNVVGQVLKAKGLQRRVQVLRHPAAVYGTRANGDMDFQVEVWEGSQAESFNKALEGRRRRLGRAQRGHPRGLVVSDAT
jgi:ABC-type proline/glycine betaine transport system substrate-binding protein